MIKKLVNRGFSGKELAKLLDVTPGSITYYKSGKVKRMDIERYNKLLKLIGISGKNKSP
ncbi:MAG: helix-turn-helix domain-containing protein [Pseudomonadota bacterium]|nr:helix-turn-helix domain-containing protein [Pseudomonadota bacterium]